MAVKRKWQFVGCSKVLSPRNGYKVFAEQMRDHGVECSLYPSELRLNQFEFSSLPANRQNVPRSVPGRGWYFRNHDLVALAVQRERFREEGVAFS